MGILDRLFGNKEEASCDVCDKEMNYKDGYVLSTNQVVTTKAYWKFVLTHQWAYFHELDPDDPTLAITIERQTNQSTGWLVCEKCSTLFDFDRGVGKNHAQMHSTAPPGNGPANPQLVESAAASVWMELYGKYPQLNKMFYFQQMPE